MKRGLLLKIRKTIALAALVMSMGISSTAFASETTDQLAATQKTLTASQKTVAALQQQLKELASEKTEIAAEKATAETTAEKTAAELNDLQAELQEVTTAEKEKQALMESMVYHPAVQSSTVNYSSRVMDVYRELNELTEKKKTVTAEQSDVHISFATLQGKIAAFTDQTTELENQEAEINAQIQTTNETIKKQQTAVTKLQKAQKAEEEKAKTAATGFASPLATKLSVSSGFGGREDPTGASGTQHDGIDFTGSYGQNVMAARDGVVEMAGTDPSAGNYVIIKHDNGYYSYYMHLSKINATVGQSIKVGQSVGQMGSTGNSTGVHLHFGLSTSVWSGFVDPSSFLGL